MRTFVLEGTAEETAEVVRAIQSTARENIVSVVAPEKPRSSTRTSTTEDGERTYVTVDFARSVLNRRPLPPNVTIVIETLKKALRDGCWRPNCMLQRASRRLNFQALWALSVDEWQVPRTTTRTPTSSTAE